MASGGQFVVSPDTRVPHAVEWLSDNGSAYIARDTADTSRALGLALLFTPVRSPESNGMSEAFVKTLNGVDPVLECAP